MRQCEGRLEAVLEDDEGWPHEYRPRCGQTVGTVAIRSLDSVIVYACRNHYSEVRARVDRDDAHLRARKDRETATATLTRPCGATT
jgi:hypothetical protein